MMTNDPDNQIPTNAEFVSEAAAAEETPPRKSVFDVLGDALKKGRADASEAAKKAAPKIRDAAEKGAFKAAYATAFGAGFGLAVLRELLPQSFKDGLRAGMKDGAKAADKAFSPEPEAPSAPQSLLV